MVKMVTIWAVCILLQATASDMLLRPLTVIGALQDRRYTQEQVATSQHCASLKIWLQFCYE